MQSYFPFHLYPLHNLLFYHLIHIPLSMGATLILLLSPSFCLTAICSFLSSMAQVEAPRGQHHLGRWWGGDHPAKRSQPSIFLCAIPSFTLPCSPSLSLPPCRLSISVCLSSFSFPLLSPLQSRLDMCDGSPFSSMPSS